MAMLQSMPAVALPPDELRRIGGTWDAEKCVLPKSSGEELGRLCDRTVGQCVAGMLGGAPVVAPLKATSLLPPQADCVEVGSARIIGGIRPQNFDVAYRPDGVRFAYDSKTLNTRTSLSKNYQNMINDLGTEAATVHTRFPSAIVAFMVAVPGACLANHRGNLTSALARRCGRATTSGDIHKAEAIALLVWNPQDGTIDFAWPDSTSPLRIEKFSSQVELR